MSRMYDLVRALVLTLVLTSASAWGADPEPSQPTRYHSVGMLAAGSTILGLFGTASIAAGIHAGVTSGNSGLNALEAVPTAIAAPLSGLVALGVGVPLIAVGAQREVDEPEVAEPTTLPGSRPEPRYDPSMVAAGASVLAVNGTICGALAIWYGETHWTRRIEGPIIGTSVVSGLIAAGAGIPLLVVGTNPELVDEEQASALVPTRFDVRTDGVELAWSW